MKYRPLAEAAAASVTLVRWYKIISVCVSLSFRDADPPSFVQFTPLDVFMQETGRLRRSTALLCLLKYKYTIAL